MRLLVLAISVALVLAATPASAQAPCFNVDFNHQLWKNLNGRTHR